VNSKRCLNSHHFKKGPKIRDGVLLVAHALSAFAVLLNSGCSGDNGPVRMAVTGRVILDTEPLNSGVIRFIPAGESAGPGAMAKIVDGEFQFTAQNGPVCGNHRVEVEAGDYLNFEIDDEQAFAEAVRKSGKSPMAKNPVPAAYNSASTLTATVTASNQQPMLFQLRSGR